MDVGITQIIGVAMFGWALGWLSHLAFDWKQGYYRKAKP